MFMFVSGVSRIEVLITNRSLSTRVGARLAVPKNFLTPLVFVGILDERTFCLV
jgi:hypothetical protein